MIGLRFGRLVVVARAGKKRRNHAWSAVCDCGTTVWVNGAPLRDGRTRSCGCLQRETARAVGDRTRTHGMTKTATYAIWDTMIQRCYNSSSKDFHNYGGRGIQVCDAWKSFEQFFTDMGDRPTGKSLDRVNNDSNYTPENCRWATLMEQSRNKRTNKLLTHQGETHCISEWAEKLGMKPVTLQTRIHKYGWSVERALTQPVGKYHAR